MNQLDDQKIRSVFSENDERPIEKNLERENLWLRIEQQLPKRRKLHTNWYRSVAAIFVLAVLSGWSITFMKYNQIKTINKQLTRSVAETDCELKLQRKQIAESFEKHDMEVRRAENKPQLPENMTAVDLLRSVNQKLKAERLSLLLTNVSLRKQINVLSMENNQRADSLRLVIEKISETKVLPRPSIEMPHEPEKQAEKNNTYTARMPVYSSGLPEKRPGRRLKIQLFNPGEPVELNRANDVGILKLFK